jgi:hypothetical protein
MPCSLLSECVHSEERKKESECVVAGFISATNPNPINGSLLYKRQLCLNLNYAKLLFQAKFGSFAFHILVHVV